jgi:predicted O-linked N-acetylglucosamine transferase (SPINDLY family)
VREGEERYYSERVLRMPNGYACYGPSADAPPVGPLPAAANGYVTLGCFNNVRKYSAAVAEAWATILRRVPSARLYLKGLDDEPVRHWWHEWFAERGIERERILLEPSSPPEDLLEYYNQVDLALDTQPYSGGLTTCEALWMGVPVITFPGKTFAGRHSTSHMTNAGYGEFVAADLAGYIDMAVGWSQRLEELAVTRAQMRDRVRKSPLCAAPQFAADLLRLLENAWESVLPAGNA